MPIPESIHEINTYDESKFLSIARFLPPDCLIELRNGLNFSELVDNFVRTLMIKNALVDSWTGRPINYMTNTDIALDLWKRGTLESNDLIPTTDIEILNMFDTVLSTVLDGNDSASVMREIYKPELEKDTEESFGLKKIISQYINILLSSNRLLYNNHPLAANTDWNTVLQNWYVGDIKWLPPGFIPIQ